MFDSWDQLFVWFLLGTFVSILVFVGAVALLIWWAL